MSNQNYNPIPHLTKLLQDDQILNNPVVLARVLRYIANRVEASIPPKPSPGLLKQFPVELDKSETAWPWLLANRPGLFDGIALHTEPYYSYIKDAKNQLYAQAIADLDNPTHADVAKVLFDDSTKTGGSYRRKILAALKIKNSTTTTDKATTTPQTAKKAA